MWGVTFRSLHNFNDLLFEKDMSIGEAMVEPLTYLSTHSSLSVVYFALLLVSHDFNSFAPLKKLAKYKTSTTRTLH